LTGAAGAQTAVEGGETATENTAAETSALLAAHEIAYPRGGHAPTLRRLLLAGDAVAVLIALVIALAVAPESSGPHEFIYGLFAVPLMTFLFKLYGLYDRDAKRISHSTVDDLPWLFHATVIGTLLLWLYSRSTPMGRLDYPELLIFACGGMVLVTAARVVLRGLASRLIGGDRALLVGGGELANAFVGKLAAHPEYRVKVIGALMPDHEDETEERAALPVLGTLDQIEDVAEAQGVSRVVFSPRDIDDRELEELLRTCRRLALQVSVLPTLSDVLGPAVEVDDVEGVTVLGINPPWLPRSSRKLKRAMDVAIAGSLLTLAFPLLLLVAIAIKLNSRGPIFFSQERVGKGGRRFRVFKFRTMVSDAEQLRADLLERSSDPNWLKLDHDPRVTRVGRRLRRLSLDELPQLWNVVRGEMSMVGPRPLIPAEDERVLGWARGRLDLTPGITGYWQVLGRTRIPFDEMVKLDYLYVMNWSLWEDVRLMLRTLPAVLGGRGAN
jgi:exopolysaccharide biosynthesis polyprenyl glycosylphosphotransferase